MVPVTNLKGLVTLPPSSSGSGTSMSGMMGVVEAMKLKTSDRMLGEAQMAAQSL
jgi:hypothetical protein